MTLDLPAVRAAATAQAERATRGTEDMRAYLARQVKDGAHREVIGPLLPASGASGVIVHSGERIAGWGNPEIPEMAYSVTKSVVSTVAGIAFDLKLIPDLHQPVADTLDLPELAGARASTITWHHLLQQTSQWDGELWGKPAWADAASNRTGSAPAGAVPGSGWAYNDVRVNLLCLALTHLFGQSLPAVLRDHILEPLGAAGTWSWHGYHNSVTSVDGEAVPVVSGGAHWGGGLWISAVDLALLGGLYLGNGQHQARQLLSTTWIERTWQPCPHNADYGYLWWLNHRQVLFPTAPPTGRCARGNADQHLLWIDPARDLVIASHWGDHVEELLHDVSIAVPTR
ncbi:serine hydrolase domain-containing protein [Labedaea rhizosphaerae]|uniref:CubicO group peptidase (Beta-lactamase class C family) n=1 Tax=Labedaea rhizosphaerae TaxID=598644 RepID=A0A4R6S8Z0_LABRH|nr:serine hydrolase [Labedaea rhizosphaerae]TDP96372.1 CubicO group peptidase (beta-lactamase class C family) [Labedaea rhizosphaerae]